MGALFNWVNNVDPLLCPNCSGSMRIISFIEDSEIIKKILKHLDLPACACPHADRWDVKRKPPPRLPVRGTQTGAHAPPIDVYPIYNEPAMPSIDDYLKDPEYPVEAYF